MNLCDYNTIRDLLARHGFHFSKSMGQNFLIDPEVPRPDRRGFRRGRRLRRAGDRPGIGPLTAELAQRAGKVVAVELDRALLPVLAETMAPSSECGGRAGGRAETGPHGHRGREVPGPHAYSLRQPALQRHLSHSGKAGGVPLLYCLHGDDPAGGSRRLCAPQGSSEGGSFSLFLQYYMKPELLFDVPPEKFLPAPKVTSAVIRCVRRERPRPWM